MSLKVPVGNHYCFLASVHEAVQFQWVLKEVKILMKQQAIDHQ